MKIDYSPYEKLVIYNIRKVSIEKFLDNHVYMGNDNNPKWIDGYLLFFYVPSDTSYIQSLEQEKHTLIWTGLEYCEMSEYEKVLKNGEQNTGCRVTDVTADPTFESVIKFIKKREKK